MQGDATFELQALLKMVQTSSEREPAQEMNKSMKHQKLMRPWMLSLVGLALSFAVDAHARVWTDTLRRTWEGEFLRIEGANAVFMVLGQERPFPLANLSPADRTFINNALAAASKPSSALPGAQPPGVTKPAPAAPVVPAAAGALDFLGVTIQPGKTVEGTAKAAK